MKVMDRNNISIKQTIDSASFSSSQAGQATMDKRMPVSQSTTFPISNPSRSSNPLKNKAVSSDLGSATLDHNTGHAVTKVSSHHQA
jgi:hypothetical protein